MTAPMSDEMVDPRWVEGICVGSGTAPGGDGECRWCDAREVDEDGRLTEHTCRVQVDASEASDG